MSDARVDGTIVVYRQFDVGWEIALDRAAELLAAHATRRARPARAEAEALHVPNPPLDVLLDATSLGVGGRSYPTETSARLFDFAVVSLRLLVRLPRDLPWAAFAEFGSRLDLLAELTPVFERYRDGLLATIRPAITRPALSPVTEDYVVFRVDALRDAEGRPLPAQALRDEDLVPLLLDETQPLSEAAVRDLLPHRFSYYRDDMAVLTWNNALVVEPNPADADVQYVLEFANAQLLQLRIQDAQLDRELPKLVARVGALRARPSSILGRRYAAALAGLSGVMAEMVEVLERVDNSLKVTDDVYLARIYSAALEIFRGRAWRAGIERKIGFLRETYGMLSAQAQAARAEALEIAIVVLIVIEIVLGLLRR
jgi:hypothetical protein